ncbi:MAG: phosphoribosylanthranilate isomerase [Oscillospiraceae bacterium]|nr:phosphoribosylanthranilate isomerase [Oscillospiraceae bacterium]
MVQIYSIQTKEEALACVAAGADRIGVAVATGSNLPAEVSMETCREIFDAVKDRAQTVLIIVSNSDEEIYAPLQELRPNVLHICGYAFSATPEFAKKVKAISPNTRLLQAIAVDGPAAIARAKGFAGFCDELILDSVDPAIAGIGAAGITHDWSISAKIVQSVDCPVILAGGLCVENVAEAIARVRPWGVDSFTKTSDTFPDGSSRKNLAKVAAFVENANAAFAQLTK